MAVTVYHDTVADGTFSTDGATHWNAAHTVTGVVAALPIVNYTDANSPVTLAPSTQYNLAMTAGSITIDALSGTTDGDTYYIHIVDASNSLQVGATLNIVGTSTSTGTAFTFTSTNLPRINSGMDIEIAQIGGAFVITKYTGAAAVAKQYGATFEPGLGTPAASGYVLSSTDAGVRSWVAAAGGGDGGFSFKYAFDTGTANDPATGTLRMNNASPEAATMLYIYETDATGVAIDTILDLVNPTDFVMLSNSDRSKFHVFSIPLPFVSGASVDSLPVTWIAGTGNTGATTQFSASEVLFLSILHSDFDDTVGNQFIYQKARYYMYA